MYLPPETGGFLQKWWKLGTCQKNMAEVNVGIQYIIIIWHHWSQEYGTYICKILEVCNVDVGIPFLSTYLVSYGMYDTYLLSLCDCAKARQVCRYRT